MTEILLHAMIMIPLLATVDGIVMDSLSLAVGPMVERADGSLGTCITYSEGVEHRKVDIGASIHFPPSSHLLELNPSIISLIDITAGTAGDNTKTDEIKLRSMCVFGRRTIEVSRPTKAAIFPDQNTFLVLMRESMRHATT